MKNTHNLLNLDFVCCVRCNVSDGVVHCLDSIYSLVDDYWCVVCCVERMLDVYIYISKSFKEFNTTMLGVNFFM